MIYMISKVNEAIERWSMLNDCSGVVVGLSGGADSVSLLYIMREICAEKNKIIRAVHINHGIRGAEADRDELFCRRLCEKIQVPVDVFSFDIPQLSKAEGIGLEECGRKYRYRCFEKISEQYNLRIATAHTLSDSAETVLLNITRGCGIAGLRGIPAVRDRIIRPLILSSRDDIERYCADNSIEYVTDETNFDDSYSRNRVRLRVIPELKKLNPDFLSAIERLSYTAYEDDQYLGNEAINALNAAAEGENAWQVNGVYGLPIAIRNRALMQVGEIISGKPVDFTQLQLLINMLNAGSGAVTLSGGKVVCISNGILCERTQISAVRAEWEVEFKPGTELPDGRCIRVEVLDCAEFVKRNEFDKSLFKFAVDYDIINKSEYRCILRNRRNGDRFAPSGRGVTKTLKKLFNESHLGLDRREELVMLECDGRIVWIEEFGAAEGFAPSCSTDKVCIISFA